MQSNVIKSSNQNHKLNINTNKNSHPIFLQPITNSEVTKYIIAPKYWENNSHES